MNKKVEIVKKLSDKPNNLICDTVFNASSKINYDELLKIGFIQVENTNRFDYFADLKVAYFAKFDATENHTLYDYPDDEIIELVNKHLKDKEIVNKRFFGCLKISYVPSSNGFWLSLYFFDDSYISFTASHSREIMKCVVDKTKASFNRYKKYLNNDKNAQRIMLKKMSYQLLKTKDQEEKDFLKNRIEVFKDQIVLLQGDYDEIQLANDSFGSGNNAVIVGGNNGYLLTCHLEHFLENDDFGNSYIASTETRGYALLEVGPATKHIFKLLL